MFSPSRFLTAQWRHLAILNYQIDPAVLSPRVPRGTELDLYDGKALVSLVGFLFCQTRVWGVPVPLHRNFEEVNLRFYVRRAAAEGWRRGVVFVKEYVPRRAVAWVARRLYGENYVAVPMRHEIELAADDPQARRSVCYQWFDGGENRLSLSADGPGALAPLGSEEEFVVEHYWGYCGHRDSQRPTVEYQVEHPRWNIWPAQAAEFVGNAQHLYGPEFAAALSMPPDSAFLADGSAVTVYRGTPLAPAAPALARP